MSKENVDLVRRGFELWLKGDFDSALQLMDDEVVTRRIAPVPDAGEWRGRDGFMNVYSEWTGMFEGFEQRPPDEYIDAGDKVIARVEQTAHPGGSDAVVSETFWYLFEIRDARLVGLEIYADQNQAFEAAGLTERD